MITIATIIIANLIPASGALFFGWDYRYALLLYWFEVIIIGLVNILKILTVKNPNPGVSLKGSMFYRQLHNHPRILFALQSLIALFILLLFYGIFVLGLTSKMTGEPFALSGAIITTWFPIVIIPALGFLLSHLLDYFTGFIASGEYQRSSMTQITKDFTKHILIIHVTIVFSGIVLDMFENAIAVFLVMVAIKIYIEIKLHLKQLKDSQAAS